jgi:hypothetical protein
MLINCIRTLPFILIRILLCLADAAVTIWLTLSFKDFFMNFMSGFVSGLFLIILTPMGYIIGLGISMVICYYVIGVIAYFFKLAHIIALTSYILDYNPSRLSTTLYAISEARQNFIPMVASYITTKTVIHALRDLKDTIMEFDIMARFKEPKSAIVKFDQRICTSGVRNVVDVADEITMSYTWFTNDLYKRSDKYKSSKKGKSLGAMTKVQAKHMLEGLVFLLRTFPYLMMTSLLYETTFIVLNVLFTVILMIFIVKWLGFSLMTCAIIFITYRAVMQIFSYTIISSLRNAAYLHAYYGELAELEPFDLKESVTGLLSKVPGLSGLAKLTGEKIDITRGKGSSPILEEDIGEVLKKSIKDTARSFNLNESDLIITSREANKIQENVDSLPEEVEDLEPIVDTEVETIVEEYVPAQEQHEQVEVNVSADDIQTDAQVKAGPFASGPRRERVR